MRRNLLCMVILIMTLTESFALKTNGLDGKSQKKEDKQLSKEKLGQYRLQQMQDLEKKSDILNTIIIKDGKTYFDLIAPQEDRPYDVVMQVNLEPEEAKERCSQCVILADQFPSLVYSFVQDRSNHHEFMERQIFFVILYIERENQGVMDAFGATGYTTIPWLSVSPAPLIQKKKIEMGEGDFFEKFNEWNILVDQTPTGMKMVEFINNALKTDIQFKLTFQQLVHTNALITGILGGFIFMIFICYKVLMFQWLWLAIACTVWVICSGGVIHNQVMNPQPYRTYFDEQLNETVIDEYFTREQYGAYSREGYMVESLVVIFSMTFALFLSLPKLIENRCLLRIACLFVGFAIFIMHAVFMDIIKIKMPWYNPKFEPPDEYMRGWILEDQGFNIL